MTKSTQQAADGPHGESMENDQPANLSSSTTSLIRQLMQMRLNKVRDFLSINCVLGKRHANDLTCTFTTGRKEQTSGASLSLPPQLPAHNRARTSDHVLAVVSACINIWMRKNNNYRMSFCCSPVKKLTKIRMISWFDAHHCILEICWGKK